MRRALLAGLLAIAACSSSKAEQRPDAPPGKGGVQSQPQTQVPPPPPGAGGMQVSPFSTGKQRVKGGESFALRGPTTVTVAKVLYLDQPCPPGAECMHSGVIKSVQFQVARGDDHQQASVAQGQPRVVGGVQLQVFDVEPGPVADIEASLPVAPVGGATPAQVPTSH